MVKIAICAPGKPLKRERSDALKALVARRSDVWLHFHEQCFLEEGHFAGSDQVRLAALLECANDPGFDAVWFAMGGYGSNRIAAQAVAQMNGAARTKSYLGYSDTGFLLGALYRHGIGRVAHGPLAGDVRREGGAAAIERALGWFKGEEDGLEPGLDTRPAVAFNLATLAIFSGAVGIGVGLGLQKTVSNFAAGFTLLADKSIKPGDAISVDGQFGWVTGMQARYVSIRTRDGTEMLLPNDHFINNGVTNNFFVRN